MNAVVFRQYISIGRFCTVIRHMQPQLHFHSIVRIIMWNLPYSKRWTEYLIGTLSKKSIQYGVVIVAEQPSLHACD